MKATNASKNITLEIINGDKKWYDGEKFIDSTDNLQYLGKTCELIFSFIARGPEYIEVTGWSMDDLYSKLLSVPIPENVIFVYEVPCRCDEGDCTRIIDIKLYKEISSAGKLMELVMRKVKSTLLSCGIHYEYSYDGEFSMCQISKFPYIHKGVNCSSEMVPYNGTMETGKFYMSFKTT